MPWGPLELCLKNNLFLQGVIIHEASQILLLGEKKKRAGDYWLNNNYKSPRSERCLSYDQPEWKGLDYQ